MILKFHLLCCENEHGTGDVVFPDLTTLDGFEVAQEASKSLTPADVRREAKKLGWGRVHGADYCPACMESL